MRMVGPSTETLALATKRAHDLEHQLQTERSEADAKVRLPAVLCWRGCSACGNFITKFRVACFFRFGFFVLLQLAAAATAIATAREQVAKLEDEAHYARTVENIAPHIQRWYRFESRRFVSRRNLVSVQCPPFVFRHD